MLERLIGEDVKLNLELAPGPGLVRIDPGQLDQILINLVINACDAMPKGGKLTIETANVDLDEEYAKTHFGIQPGSYVMLAVSDTGTGIDKEVLPHIFEPFFTTKPVGKGTGLGLATVYGVVQQSGGEIFVYSESDQGSTFKIYLPRVESGTPSQPEAKSRSEILGGTETVLVVEDDKGVRGAIVAILKKRGYKIIEAPSGKEAIGLLTRQKEPIALMITDVVMPEMSGKQLADQVRTLRPEIKILFLSGYTENVIAHHGVLEPGINFLAKPFSIQSLTKKVREVLDQQNK
jgi:CheY-like chemotaxis protein